MPQGEQTALTQARVDSWTWAVRLFKTRSAAAEACRGGHVRVNGSTAKPAQPVRPGDEIRIRAGGVERIVIVERVITKRVGAPVAAQCLIDRSPPPPSREILATMPRRDRGSGRPTKRERRETDRLLGRTED
ncbi:RNA-binding S4 domain-containing protein [Nocardia amikacinitolerans]|uniref:Heat shock protein Hsp15 n=1 Tax=Nocardia amikacinitolerans TaxID=756689 RepID=A0A285LUQ8_9NOCA|nr:RNA-binding S4 domain-containing protein [Nocardia amikacinitolerans]MCP2276644.1 ribosome-associated heat shock protein Hsp15 [Nocardia amikacinitolerans]MCP2291457.1 ribosome-associated heat shock protein Hsp15 [Nocardia amikacinitolerans]MCP2294975.1 ribosome-associated heat shock protein Hsp15 [Nocardia amikacinitolerans]MCP2320411.1 ribosome-associated heat shock protein Hsp15 [Nocardia amikacinitolerans]SNY87406.1 heat shock protein Hsp15 [Nocardia amikacinitolerans]